MKIESKKLGKEFRPIEMKITIESVEELRELWHRLNAPLSVVVQYSDKHHCDKHLTTDFWRILDQELNRLEGDY